MELKEQPALSFTYQAKLTRIQEDLNLPTEAVFIQLIDLYYLEDIEAITLMRKRLTLRLSKGLNKRAVTQLRLIYSLLGHLLQKLRYL